MPATLADRIRQGRRAGYSGDGLLTYVAGSPNVNAYSGTDEQKIQQLMQATGKQMLPYEYAAPERSSMPPAALAEMRRLESLQQGIQPTLPPIMPNASLGQSLWDLAMLPVSSLEQESGLPLSLIATVRNPAGKTVPGELSASGKYIPAPTSVLREAERLVNLRGMTMDRATKEAEGRLRWQEWQRPEIEKDYGPLRPAAPGATKRRLLQNTQAAVDERIQRTMDILSEPAGVWTPQDYGIFDRSRIKDALTGFPDVPQSPRFPRSTPVRGDVAYMDEIYNDPRNRELIKKQIERGLPLGGETFYASMWPVKTEWMGRGGSPAKFDKWLEATAPASAKNALQAENAVGNLLQMLHYQGIPLTAENVEKAVRAYQQRFGMRLPLMEGHREGVKGVLEGTKNLRQLVEQNQTDFYKVPTYSVQKRGDFLNSIVGDTHESAGHTFGSKYHPYFWTQSGFGKYEYGPMEGHMLDIGKEMGGLPGGMTQAGRWFGGGPVTGLLSAEGDALDQIERQAAYTMHEKGLPTDPVSVRNYVMDLIEKGGELAIWTSKTKPMPERRTRAPQGRNRSR